MLVSPTMPQYCPQFKGVLSTQRHPQFETIVPVVLRIDWKGKKQKREALLTVQMKSCGLGRGSEKEDRIKVFWRRLDRTWWLMRCGSGKRRNQRWCGAFWFPARMNSSAVGVAKKNSMILMFVGVWRHQAETWVSSRLPSLVLRDHICWEWAWRCQPHLSGFETSVWWFTVIREN